MLTHVPGEGRLRLGWRPGRATRRGAAAGLAHGHRAAVGAGQAARAVARRHRVGAPSASRRRARRCCCAAASSCWCPIASQTSGRRPAALHRARSAALRGALQRGRHRSARPRSRTRWACCWIGRRASARRRPGRVRAAAAAASTARPSVCTHDQRAAHAGARRAAAERALSARSPAGARRHGRRLRGRRRSARAAGGREADSRRSRRVGGSRPTRFRREARAAAAFAHLHVVRVYDFGLDREGRAFLVMELLEGETLRQRLGAGAPLPTDEVAARAARRLPGGERRARAGARAPRPEAREHLPAAARRPASCRRCSTSASPRRSAPQWIAQVDAQRRAPGCWSARSTTWLPSRPPATSSRPAWDIWALGVIAYEMLTRQPSVPPARDFGGSDAADDRSARDARRSPRTRTSRSRPPPSSGARSPRNASCGRQDALTSCGSCELALR